MALPGLSTLNPYVPSVPGAGFSSLAGGSGVLQQGLADIALMGEAARARVNSRIAGLAVPSVSQASAPTIAFSPSRREFFVQGRTFSSNDAQSAIESETLLGQPGVPLPAGDWVPLTPESYGGYLQGIKNPSLGTLFSRGVSRGIDSSQLLLGRGLQLAGFEGVGGRMVDQQMEDLRRNAPYARQFTDIRDPGDALEWFVAGLGEQIPNILESVAVAGAGAIGGTFSGGPGVGTAAGALAGLAGRSAFRQQVLAAARKKAAGEVLSAAESQILRSAGALVGATAATFANSYRVGASDIYGELREQGADPDDVSAKMLALAGAFPYAAAESATEYLLASRIFGAALNPPAGASVLRRGAVGAAVGGVAEGGTELVQESLLLGLSDQDFSDPENVERLINAFAAGALIGAPGGAIANLINLRTDEPTNLLSPGGPADMLQLEGPGPTPPLLGGPSPTPPLLGGPPQGQALTVPGGQELMVPGTAVIPGGPTQGQELMVPGTDVVPSGGPQYYSRGERQPGLPAPPFLRTGSRPDFVVDESGGTRAGTDADTPLSLPYGYVPPVGPDTQGVLDVFPGGQTPAGNLRSMMEPPAPVLGITQQGSGAVTPAQAAEEWRALAGRGRPKPFANFLPEIQEQWIDALNMARAGELSADDLKAIRAELVAAENVARLTKSRPRTVVVGNMQFDFSGGPAQPPAPTPTTPPTPTPPPTPPKGGGANALAKPKAAAVSPAEQPAARGAALKRPVARAVAEPAGKPAAKPEGEAKVKAAPVQKRQGEAVQVLKKGEEKPAKVEKTRVSPGEARGKLTDAARLDDAITFVEEATARDDRDDIYEAYYDILELAFFERLSSGTVEGRKAVQTKARQFLEQPTSKLLRPSLVRAFRAIVLREDTLPANGPWLQFMLDNDLTDAFPAKAKAKVEGIDKIKDDALRAQAEALFAVKKQPAVTKQATYQSKPVDIDSPAYKLTVLLASRPTVLRLDRPFVFRQEQYENLPAALEDLYAQINTGDHGALVNGYPLKDYFTADGKPKFETTPSGLNTPTIKTDDDGRFTLGSFNRPDMAAPAVGKLRMAVTRFVSKLARKPKTYIYRNQADMKAKNPALYRKAVAARPEGDFDTAPAAGYSFGDGNVVIFTDRIANEQHLNFVLAHETLGHFGLRGIIPNKQFDATMEAIYKASPAIRSDVDIAMANGRSKAEAVEEYLSDFAAVLDTSIVARVWNAIKGALNKLGIKFGDEMVRYILKQSRSYVRSGKSNMFDAAKVFTDLQNVEYGVGYASTGRFSTVGDIYADNRTAELVRDKLANAPLDWERAWSVVKNVAGNTSGGFDRFKAQFLSLANFRALVNPGLSRLEEILEAARDLASSIRVSSNERNAEVFNNAIFGKHFGVTEEQTSSINRLIYAAQRFAVSKIEDVRTLKGEPLYEFKDGELVPNQPEIDKLTKRGMVTLKEARDGFTYKVQLPDGTMRDERFEGIPGLTKDSIEWRGYLSLRETMNSVELQLLRTRYQSLLDDQKITFKQFNELVEGDRLTDAESSLLRRIVKTYSDLYTADITFDERGYPKLSAEAMQNGNDFVVAINKALVLGQDRDFNAVADFFEGKAADDMVAKLREFRKRLKLGEENKFTIQNRIKQLGVLDMSNSQADLYTRRTLATGYTPLLREGQFQVRVEAVNPRTGKVVRLADAYREQLVYSQVEKESEALELATGINEVFKDKTYKVQAYSQDGLEYTEQTVVFRAVPETALDAIAGPPELNLNEFVYGLRQLDIILTPKEVERVVTALTRQNSSARNRLLRSFTPGADPDAIKAISRHVDSRASTIAKTAMRPQLSELMNLSMKSTRRMWEGDPVLLDDLERAAKDTNASPEARALAQREYQRYKYMYEQTNPEGKSKRGNQFYNEASRTVAFLDDNRDVSESNFESGAVVSQVRAATSIMQLGGSIATGVLNLISAYTNGLPFLASYNPRNGFGGGFGMGPAVREFHIAASQVGALGITNMKANTAEFYDAVAKSKDLQTKHGLKAHEAEFIAREIREGAMIPAQSNALINTSRGQISSGFTRKFVDGWMLPFNLTEQASRRSLGLAAYRLEYERQIAGGKTETKAQEAARRFATDTLNLTMGEYSVLNRPPAWRSGIQSFLYMYKVFPTTSIQLFANMSRSGQIAMLASLWLLSGLQGLPLAEDIEDLVDTLAQTLGFKAGSIRMEIAKFIDGIFPGMSPFFLQGIVNSVVPADIAGRVSLGNVFPGTGILLSGADVGRELGDIAGPAPAALLGTANFFIDAVRAPFSDRVQLLDVVREAPVTMLRATGDAIAYAKSDAIVDRRGYVVVDEANAAVIAARMLGFYPSAAAQQYSSIRIATRVANYQRDVVAGFRQAWIKAKMEGDEARAREIVRAVERWNKGAEGTGLEIGNFVRNSQRALREARMPAGERTLRTLPLAGRDDLERTFELMTY